MNTSTSRLSNLQAALVLGALLSTACLLVTVSRIWKTSSSTSWLWWENIIQTDARSGFRTLRPHEPQLGPPAAGPENQGQSTPADPVDLTTAAANVPPPSPDHPLMLAFPVRPSQISPRTNNPRSMADLTFALSDHEIRLTLLEQGIEQWQTKRRGR